mgnify:FL=1
MIVRNFAFYADMPDDMRYLRKPGGQPTWIEQDMVFLLPPRLKDFRKNLFHVRRAEKTESALYASLFQVKCVVAGQEDTTGFDGPYDVFPFYEKVFRRRRQYRDYYVLFLFRHKTDYQKYMRLC